jgi:hypothetical protein
VQSVPASLAICCYHPPLTGREEKMRMRDTTTKQKKGSTTVCPTLVS